MDTPTSATLGFPLLLNIAVVLPVSRVYIALQSRVLTSPDLIPKTSSSICLVRSSVLVRTIPEFSPSNIRVQFIHGLGHYRESKFLMVCMYCKVSIHVHVGVQINAILPHWLFLLVIGCEALQFWLITDDNNCSFLQEAGTCNF
jgi:hypothetical protein